MVDESVSNEELFEEIVAQNHDNIEGAINVLYKVFRDFGWAYYDSELPPTRNKLKETIIDLMQESFNSCGETFGTGRLYVSCAPKDNENVFKGELSIDLKVL